jgi:hypothetical protein
MPAWEEDKHIDLLLSLYAGIKHDFTKDHQDLVVAAMKAKGHDDTNWDMLRYAPILLCV